VIVIIGQMGTSERYGEAVWMEAWGKSYPTCQPCWQATCQVAQAHRPALVITDTTAAR